MSDPEKKMGESFPSKLEDLEKRSIRLMKDPLKRCKKSYSPEMLSKRCRTEAGQGIPGVSNFTEIKSVSTGSAKRHNLEKENGEFAKVPKIDERCTVTECQYGKAVRKSFVFLKNNIIYEDLQDALRQQDIVSEIEEAEYVCQKQSRQSMCEKLIKHIIKKKRCTVFTELMETKSKFIFERIFEACKQIQEDDAEKDAKQRKPHIVVTDGLLQRHLACLHKELEPREIVDEMFEAGDITGRDHDTVTDPDRKYKRMQGLLDILKKKELYSNFVFALESLNYVQVLDTLKKDRNVTVESSKYAFCITQNFCLLKEELPVTDDARIMVDQMYGFLNEANISDINYFTSARQKTSKLLKILLTKREPACKELFRVMEVDLKREDLIWKMREKSAEIEERGIPVLDPLLRSLHISCLKEHEDFLLEELEPLELCDLLFEESAIDIPDHDRITETNKISKQIQRFLETVKKNENNCFHFLLFILGKNGYREILEELVKADSGPKGAETDAEFEWRVSHKFNNTVSSESVQNRSINVKLTVEGSKGRQVEQALHQQVLSTDTGIIEEAATYGQMTIEDVSTGSVVIQLRPITDQAVRTLLNARENNRLVEFILGMIKRVNIPTVQGTEPLEIRVQVSYSHPPAAKPDIPKAELTKQRVKVYRNELVSELEPGALISLLSKSECSARSAMDSIRSAPTSSERTEKLLSLIENGDLKTVEAFITALKDVGYREILELIDPIDIHSKAENVRKVITSNYKNILDEMQISLAKETLSKCIGDVDTIQAKISPKNGKRRQRMTHFLQFILQEDHNVIQFETMLRNHGLEYLLKKNENVRGEHITIQDIEIVIAKDQVPSSEGVLFESLLTLSPNDNDYEGLQDPPVRRQLQNILRQYPDGPQIIRELVQNAEDAKASTFKVMTCMEDNLGDGVFDYKYKKIFQGPALCTFNDGIFTEKDWKGIKTIYVSLKEKDDTFKIGRFGLGFKSVFHLTDTPVIISGDRLLIIDPTSSPERVCHNVTFKKLTSKYKSTLWPVLKKVLNLDNGGVFGFEASFVKKGYFPSTLFWFPLRRAPSSLLDKIYLPSRMMELVESFRKEADSTLLFLRYISSITIMENRDSVLYEVTIEGTSTSVDNFSGLRECTRDWLKNTSTKPEDSQSVAYNALVITRNGKEGSEKKAKFKIVNFYQGTKEMSQDLKTLSEDGDNAPFVGVAYPLQIEESFTAHVFCFLPLPFQSSSLTNLPVHVNGFFNLDPARDHVLHTTAGQVGERDKNIEWNERLIQEVISQAYIKLIEDLFKEGSPREIVYRCLPDVQKVESALWKLLIQPVMESVLRMNIFQTEKQEKTWVNYEQAVFDVFVDREREIAEETKEVVIELIKEYEENLVILPKHLRVLVESNTEYRFLPEIQPKVISTEYIANLLLKDNRYKEKKRCTKLVLLDYFLEYGHQEEWKQLELLPTNDKTHFVSLASTRTLYLCSETEAALFPELEKQLLSDLKEDMKVKLMTMQSQTKSLRKWSRKDFPQLLKASVEAQGIVSSTQLDNTIRQKVSSWIKGVWSFLSDNQDLISDVEMLPILPESRNGKSAIHSLHSLKGDYMLTQSHGLTPLPVEVREVLKICDVTLLEAVSFVPDEIVNKYIAYPTAEDACKVLEKAFKNNESYIDKINQLPVKTRKGLAVFLGKSSSKKMIDSFKKSLRKLKLFPVSKSHKAGAELYSVVDVAGIVLLQSLKDFPVKYPTLLIDGRFQGLSLAYSLGCQEYEEQRLMEKTLCAISSHQIYQPKEVASFMNYFLKRLDDSTSEKQLEIASRIPFVETGNNEFKAPKDLFNPFDSELHELFQGEEASRFPKNSVDCWKLQKLKTKTSTHVTATDLLETITFMATTETNLDCAKRKKKANAVLKFIGNLQQESEFSKFIEEVRLKCWMPVMRKRPERYPKQMDWKGEEKKVCRPIDVCSQENSSIVGSVCFISDCDQTQEMLQCLLRTPNTELVIQQLKHLAEKYKDLKQPWEYEWMLKELFDFLAPKDINPADLKELDIVPTKLSFTKSSNVYIEFFSDTCQIQLEPYMFQLSKCWTVETEMRNFFIHIGCKECLTNEDLILVQEKIRKYHNCIDIYSAQESTEIKRDLHILIDILNILKANSDKLSQEQLSRVLFPVQTKTEQLVLMPAQACTYTEDKHTEFQESEGNEEDANEKLNFVHEMVTENVADHFGVPFLTRRVMESGGIQDLEFEQWGQEEPLTTRIRNLLEEYADGLSVFKEMLQNADDAGARCMKILYDERQNEQARTGLIDKGMEECQGPALWFYNDAKFEDRDFQNIIKLGGGTKKLENTKIGKFGLGFCSVYNITDVPSIISGKYIVFFDPRTIHLGKAIKDKSKPGLRIPISKMVRKFKKQFMPYNKIFSCDLSPERSQEEYEGTLFRLPLRTATQAKEETNSISSEEYRRADVVSIIKKFMESAGNLLLFTQNVEKIELYSLQADDPERCCLLYLVERSGGSKCTNLLEKAKDLVTYGEKRYVDTFDMDISVQVSSSDAERFFRRDYENTMTGSVSRWTVSWAVSNIEQELKGSLPVASTAIPLSFSLDKNQSNAPYGFYNTGHVFCFLPLPQESQTLVHLNGCFAVEQSRKRIVSPSKDVTDKEKQADWNKSLMSTALSTAYINMLENIQSSTEYSAVWPMSFEGNPLNPLVSAFYKDICQSKCKVFYQDGNPFDKVSLEECVFLDFNLQDDPELGTTAFQCLKKFNPFPRQVMHMSLNVQQEFQNASCESYLEKQICSEESFFTSVFLVNLQDNFWNSDAEREVRSHFLRRILRSGNQKVFEKMKDTECIPTRPEGLLKKPSDLIDPTSDLHEMFGDSDSRFPEDEFMLSDFKQALINIGMNTKYLPNEMLLERVHSIHICGQGDSEIARKRCIAVLKYITRINPSHSVLEEIKGIPFLPVMKKPNDWPCMWGSSQDCQFAAPGVLFRMDCKFLIGNVQKIVDENIIQVPGYDLLRNLSMKSSENVVQDLVICQLETISKLGSVIPNSIGKVNNLRRICEEVYQFFNDCGQLDTLRRFKDLPCIFTQSGELVKPCHTSLKSTYDIPPFIHKIDSRWSDYEDFLLSVGVQQSVESDFIVNILENMEMVEGKAVENLDAVIKLLNLLDGSKHVKEFLLPDKYGIIRKPKDMCFDDGNDKISDRNLNLTHADLRVTVCKKFNVQSKSAKYIRKFKSSKPFGQKEKLVTRLSNILEDYPCDISILNELLQNADDAGATEIHFVYDKRHHSEEGLFDESMKSIQGPALVVFNDSCFSEEDIEGISNLGEGSKSEDPNKTGQFGIGFNAVYHITDAPSFLSKGEKTPNGGTLIMFDPHCRYVPDATAESPGLRVDGVDDLSHVEETYSGTYQTYLQDILPASSGTWFRFPLRTKEMADKSEIRNEEIDDDRMSQILLAFKEEMSKSLLFLNNVRCIKLSEIKDDGEISTHCEVSATLNEEDSIKKGSFQSKCTEELSSLKNGQKVLGDHFGFSCNYFIDIKVRADDKKWNEIWAVSRVFGTMTKNALTDELRLGYKTKKVNLSPRAGIAACLTPKFDSDSEEIETNSLEVCCEHGGDLEKTESNSPENLESSRAFCFLPLPCRTGLPVHINGHFALNTSRSNIWRDGKNLHTVKGAWNELILSEILPFAYITSLQFLQKILFPGMQGIHADSIEVYNQFFPVIDRITDDIWKTVAKNFYNIVVSNDIALFPVLFDEETINSMKATDFILARETITDKGNSAVAFVPLENQEQKFPAYFNQLEEQLTVETKELADESGDSHLEKVQMLKHRCAEITKILKMLGLKVLNSTYEILRSIKMSIAFSEDIEFVPKAIEALDVMQYLLSWNSDYKDRCRIDSVDVEIQLSVLKDVTNVETLLSYCFQNGEHINHLEGIPLCVLESGILTCFSESSPKIVSKFCHLLWDSKDAFLNSALVHIFEKSLEKSQCIQTLTIARFAELLEDNLNDYFKSEDPVSWNPDDLKETWIKEVWTFLASTNRKEEVAKDCIQYLSDWCLVPSKNRTGEYYLYPFCLANTVLSTNFEWKDGTMSQVMPSMDFPKLLKLESHQCKRLANYLCASESTPHNILRLFQYHRRRYCECISTTIASQILFFLLAKLHSEVKEKDDKIMSIFRDACLFETYDGSVTDLPLEKKTICLKDEDNFPQGNLSNMCDCLEITLLRRKDFLEDFGIVYLKQEDFYVDIFLPNANSLDNSIIRTHMEHIKNTKMYAGKQMKRRRDLIWNIAWIENEETGIIQRVCDFYSPYLDVCYLLCSRTDLLPVKFHDSEWEDFMEFAGIKKDVPFEMLLDFGRQIENSSSFDELLKRKSKVLLNYIFQKKKLEEGFPAFMRKFRKINCVLPFEVPELFTQILPQRGNGGFVCFEGSVFSKGWELIWSQCIVIPEKIVGNVDGDILGIRNVPDVSDVINHIHRLCSRLKTQCTRKSLNYELMECVYTELYSMLRVVSSTSKTFLIQELKRGLTETPFIYNHYTDEFLCPYQVALHLDTEKSIEGYLHSGPEKFGKFNEMFREIGVEDHPGFYHYLRLFNSLGRKTSSKTMAPEEIEVAQEGFEALLKCLKAKKLDFSGIPQLVDLYLPSEDNKLVLSKQLVLCDRSSFKERLGKESTVQYVKMGLMKNTDLLKKLPDQFRPQVLSELFEEVTDIGDECEADEHISRLRRIFQSEAFVEGIINYIQTKRNAGLNQQEKSSITRFLQNVRFKQVTSLQTVLKNKENNVLIDITRRHKHIYYKKTEGEIVIYLKMNPSWSSFEQCFKAWKSKLSQVVCLGVPKRMLLSHEDGDFIAELLCCDSDIDIVEVCKNHRIQLQSKSWRPALGSRVPIDLHDTLDNTFCDFQEGDIVANEVFDPLIDVDSEENIRVLDSEFIYVCVVKKEDEAEFPHYTVYDGTKNMSVSSIKLYRFVRKTEEQTTDLVPFSTDRIQKQSTCLNRILADIKRMLIAAWKLPRAERRAIIKRLLLQWHPDKNPGNTDLAKEVTQFILDIIGKLERGETGTEDYAAGYSGGGSSYHYGTSQNEWHHFQQNVNSCGSRRHQNRRRGGYSGGVYYSGYYAGGYYGGATYSPRPPDPQPAVGLQWLRQSKYDCRAAIHVLSTGEQQDSNAVKIWNWVCYTSHQSCEKALKAVLYGQDANIASIYRNTHDLSSLASASSSLAPARDPVNEFASNITSHHTTLRYPADGQLPGDRFTKEQAQKAVDIAERVIDACENCLM